MSNAILQGTVSFVNHEKKYVMIEYEANGKKKTINGSVDDTIQLKLKKDGLIKKIHTYHIGDCVNFIAQLSGKGDKMVANNIKYLYNTALDVLINKSKTENNFIGYLKMADNKIFVKEIDSYLFFPVSPSLWRIMPTEQELNEPVTFSLENTANKTKITAKLFNNNYIPEFYTAVKLYKAKTALDAEVYKITEYGIYLNVIGDKIQAKLAKQKNAASENIKVGDTIKIKITYLSPAKIIVEEVKG